MLEQPLLPLRHVVMIGRAGQSHGGVRWKTVSWATCGAISGTNWKALAPVPITATRLPVRSTSWRQRAEWKAGPAKLSQPGMSG